MQENKFIQKMCPNHECKYGGAIIPVNLPDMEFCPRCGAKVTELDLGKQSVLCVRCNCERSLRELYERQGNKDEMKEYRCPECSRKGTIKTLASYLSGDVE